MRKEVEIKTRRRRNGKIKDIPADISNPAKIHRTEYDTNVGIENRAGLTLPPLYI